VIPQRVGLERAGELAALHAAAFEAAWSEVEMAALLEGAGTAALLSDGGFILLRALAGEAEVLTLAVTPDARRRGLGRRLLRKAMAEAAAAGALSLFLEVAADNASALSLYASEGFAEVGRRRGYYARKGRPGADALVLRRALPSPEG
jgi:ribosomal-protein-alanine N-acetyltransferase